MKEINRFIDQTILKPDATKKEILEFIEGVRRYQFYCAVVNPCWVSLLRKKLPAHIKIGSVVGFPLGGDTIRIKALEAAEIVKLGCDEIDMVINIGRLKDKDYNYITEEIKAVVDAARGRVVKVILECCLLTVQEKIAGAKLVKNSGANFVKTSTGFSKGGAVLEDVRLLRETVGGDFGVKASGGIRTYEQAQAFLDVGADRIGTSAGIRIMEEFEKSRAPG